VRQTEVEAAAQRFGLTSLPSEDVFSTLAAAYAASGDFFPGAIQTQGKVLSMLRNRPATIAEPRRS